MQKNSPVFPLFQKGIDAKMKELTQAAKEVSSSFESFIKVKIQITLYFGGIALPPHFILYQEKIHFFHKRYRYIENVKLQLHTC